MVQWLWFAKLHVNNAQNLQDCNIVFVFLTGFFMDEFKMEVFCQIYQAQTGKKLLWFELQELVDLLLGTTLLLGEKLR